MNECVYNYSLQDNLNATKFLLQTKSKRKTNIVAMFLIALTVLGVLVSIGALIAHTKYWYVGIISVLLILAYFLVDKIVLDSALRQQKEFYETKLYNVTKVKVTIDGEKMTEIFMAKENVIGTNSYNKSDLTAIKLNKDNIYYVFKDQFVVLIKRKCLKEKAEIEFCNFAENILKPTKNKKEKLTNKDK